MPFCSNYGAASVGKERRPSVSFSMFAVGFGVDSYFSYSYVNVVQNPFILCSALVRPLAAINQCCNTFRDVVRVKAGLYSFTYASASLMSVDHRFRDEG